MLAGSSRIPTARCGLLPRSIGNNAGCVNNEVGSVPRGTSWKGGGVMAAGTVAGQCIAARMRVFYVTIESNCVRLVCLQTPASSFWLHRLMSHPFPQENGGADTGCRRVQRGEPLTSRRIGLKIAFGMEWSVPWESSSTQGLAPPLNEIGHNGVTKAGMNSLKVYRLPEALQGSGGSPRDDITVKGG